MLFRYMRYSQPQPGHCSANSTGWTFGLDRHSGVLEFSAHLLMGFAGRALSPRHILICPVPSPSLLYLCILTPPPLLLSLLPTRPYLLVWPHVMFGCWPPAFLSSWAALLFP